MSSPSLVQRDGSIEDEGESTGVSESQPREASASHLQPDAASRKRHRDFPCGPVAKTLSSRCREHGFDPWSEN